MKKFLLFATMAVAALSASANDYYDVILNGKTLTDGETVDLAIAKEEIGTFVLYSVAADFNVVSKNSSPVQSFCTINEANGDNASFTSAGYSVSLCFKYGGANGLEENCLMSTDTNTLYSSNWVMPGSDLNKFEWQAHFNNLAEDSKFKVKVEFYCSANADSDAKIEDSKTTVYINVAGDDNAVDAINSDNAPARYYDMQGRLVANPEAGLYIVRRGNKTTKEFIR